MTITKNVVKLYRLSTQEKNPFLKEEIR